MYLSSLVQGLDHRSSTAVSETEISEELRRVLTSGAFLRTPRARLLLEHIVDRYQSGKVIELSEYAIGLTVFGRDPAIYSTAVDPIVRVQMGRLREKLNHYYATNGQRSDVKISVPLRSYRPLIVRCGFRTAVPHITFVPLDYLGDEAQVKFFNQGLNEELSYRMYERLGANFVWSREPNLQDRSGISDANHQLTGTLRADCAILRVGLRLLSVKRQCDLWRTQIDAPRKLLIAVQTRLAGECSLALEYFFQEKGV